MVSESSFDEGEIMSRGEIRASLGERRLADLKGEAERLEITEQELLRRAVDLILCRQGAPESPPLRHQSGPPNVTQFPNPPPTRPQTAPNPPPDRHRQAAGGTFKEGGGSIQESSEGVRQDSTTLKVSSPRPRRKVLAKTNGADRVAAAFAELPPVLDTEDGREAVHLWMCYKHERREDYTPSGLRQLLAKMAGWGPARALAAVKHSMAMPYQGLFEERVNGNGGGNGRSPHRSAGHPNIVIPERKVFDPSVPGSGTMDLPAVPAWVGKRRAV